jgi:hypothetical protein
MDQPLPPDPGDLGISDVEYERIVRDMRRRGHHHVPTRVAPAQQRPQGPAVPRPLRWAFVGLGAVSALLLLLGRLAGASDGPAYAFIDTVDGHPVTYASCHPIQVAVYPAGGPPGAEKLVREAVDIMRSATGLDIVVVGAFGGHAANWNFKAAPIRPDDPISVSWQDGDAIAEMTDDTAGLGGSAEMTVRNGGKRYVSGTIALSRDYYATLAANNDHAEMLAVLLHEFGHVVGLDHVSSSGELMYEHNIGRKSFGPGDLEGLRILGQGPCT